MKLDNKVHEVLFSEATLKLGELHWALLKSASVMDSKRWKVIGATIGSTHEDTDFGKEVGLDEIHLWIFEKETDADELLANTERTLKAAQTLKNASAKLKAKEPQSYRGLLLTLRDFAEQHSAEIDSLHGYVAWLMKRDVMAPRILFTYRVWGSTLMSDRQIDVEGEENARSDISKLQVLTEIVLGVRQGRYLVYDNVYNEIGLEIYESVEPGEMPGNAKLVVPENYVLRRTGYEVYERLREAVEIRDPSERAKTTMPYVRRNLRFPKCDRSLIQRGTSVDDPVITGEMAHIVADS